MHNPLPPPPKTWIWGIVRVLIFVILSVHNKVYGLTVSTSMVHFEPPSYVFTSATWLPSRAMPQLICSLMKSMLHSS